MFRDRARGFSLLLAATASVAAVVQTAKPAPIRQMLANGVNLSYVEQGQGTPVVFVHGAAGDLRYWLSSIASCSSTWRRPPRAGLPLFR